MDPGMNQLLKWSIENSEATRNDSTAFTDPKAERLTGRGLNQEAIQSLMGGPSDAQLMKESMTAIQSPDVALEHKLVAFDNLEQLIEIIDNANNMESLGLWTPLTSELRNEEPEMRRMAAWCLGTALLAVNAVPVLLTLALDDPNEQVRRKAIYALSSEVRNYDPALRDLVQHLPEAMRPSGPINAGDMDEVDKVMDLVKKASQQSPS
ncbi:MAG: hypothetical protein Q9218_001562 [Villophora microphyllina]